jgi:hypothetical protein
MGTSYAVQQIRSAIKTGKLQTSTIILRGAERLDTLAGSIYGDASYWWVLAAASDIGWGLQVPPGTIINIVDLSAVASLVG